MTELENTPLQPSRTETESVQDLPPFVIPDTIQHSIESGVNNSLRFFVNPQTLEPISPQPQSFLLLERSGPIAFQTLNSALQRLHVPTGTEFRTVIDRRFHNRFHTDHPKAALDIFDIKGNPQFPHHEHITQYAVWLKHDKQALETVDFLAERLKNSSGNLAVVDDTLQLGTTLGVTTPLLLKSALEQIGRPDITLRTNAGKHMQSVLDSLSPTTERIPSEPMTVTLLSLVKDPNWISDIAVASFKDDVPTLHFGAPAVSDIVLGEYIAELMKGSVKKSGVNAQPLTEWSDLIQLGERIAKEKETSGSGSENPAVFLEKKYGRENCMRIAALLSERMRDIGSRMQLGYQRKK
ncbi:hypothetical protein IPM65_04185 [Candidatus Roizmanbacteria bacterium]|nr:MAG: hypothetical protein IPM65_04185 [Candidatus Roizmanbacteria bacterium]